MWACILIVLRSFSLKNFNVGYESTRGLGTNWLKWVPKRVPNVWAWVRKIQRQLRHRTKTRYNRSETPPDDIKTQVIYTEKGMSMLLFFPVISKYPERSLYSHTNSHNNVATQCHVDDAHRELGLPVTLRSLTDRVKAGVKQWKQRWRFWLLIIFDSRIKVLPYFMKMLFVFGKNEEIVLR